MFTSNIPFNSSSQADILVKSCSDLFESLTSEPALSVSPLPGAGSARRYFRVEGAGHSAVGVYGPDSAENDAFINLSAVFRSAGVNVPEVYGRSGLVYLQQDLGSTDLFSLILKGEEGDLPERVMQALPRMQLIDPSLWQPAVGFPPFGRRLIGFDLNYFKYEFLKPSGVDFSEERLEDDFEALAERLLVVADRASGFMWRDCQSRNVMICDGLPYFIDFQGGRRGPSLYDAVSFAWQARAGFSHERRMRLLDVYAREYCALRGDSLSPEEFLAPLGDIVLFRTLQVLGAYGFRGLVERKAHFLMSIGPALDNLCQAAALGWLDPYPEIRRLASELRASDRFRSVASDGRLHVKVFSFSYKKGYPDDFSGNGGGFMFDCRAMHNPGRYDEYKPLTGLDAPVIDFLEERGEVQSFLKNACELVDPAVDRYLKRGFSSLQVGFGCTGGRHRSVYCAQHLAEHLAGKFPDAVIHLVHRERGISATFNDN